MTNPGEFGNVTHQQPQHDALITTLPSPHLSLVPRRRNHKADQANRWYVNVVHASAVVAGRWSPQP
jgi:hypothetical protein